MVYANFREPRTGEVRKSHLLGGSVHKRFRKFGMDPERTQERGG